MKAFLLIVFGFAVFTASIQAEPKASDSASPDTAEKLQADPTETKPQPDNDLGIKENLNDILQDDDDIVEDLIPSLDELTTDSDPIALGQEIKKITDPETRTKLVTQLKKARDENRDTLPGKFYKAALTSIKNQEKATNYWAKELETATAAALESGVDLASLDNTAIGSPSGVIGNARTLARINPLGIVHRRAESVLLTVLSDASKNLGKFSDSVYDTAGNIHAVNKKVTTRLQGVPFVGEIKSNVDDAVEDHLKRSKFLVASFTDAGAQTFAALAKDSAQKADEKEALFRQYTAKTN